MEPSSTPQLERLLYRRRNLLLRVGSMELSGCLQSLGHPRISGRARVLCLSCLEAECEYCFRVRLQFVHAHTVVSHVLLRPSRCLGGLLPPVPLFAPLRDKVISATRRSHPGSPGRRPLKHNTEGPVDEAVSRSATDGKLSHQDEARARGHEYGRCRNSSLKPPMSRLRGPAPQKRDQPIDEDLRCRAIKPTRSLNNRDVIGDGPVSVGCASTIRTQCRVRVQLGPGFHGFGRCILESVYITTHVIYAVLTQEALNLFIERTFGLLFEWGCEIKWR